MNIHDKNARVGKEEKRVLYIYLFSLSGFFALTDRSKERREREKKEENSFLVGYSSSRKISSIVS